MDIDFIKNDVVPKSIPRSSLFHGDTLRLLSAKLDPSDVVSLLYLMIGDGNANDTLYLKLAGMEKISAEAIDFPKTCEELIPCWSKKIIEALVEIQLYDALLEVFRINKLDAIYNVSVNDRVLNMNKVKIFRVCDGLDAQQTGDFLNRMCSTVLSKGPANGAKMPPCSFDYLEIYFMFWQMAGIIVPSGKGIEMILEGLQVTGSERLFELFLPPEQLTLDDYTLAEYQIKNPDRVGLCVIVNQSLFDDPRNNRTGADFDEKSMKDVMEFLNFDVITRQNLLASEMVQDIKETINSNFKKHHSMLFVCIMSHGQEQDSSVYVMGSEGMYLSTQSIVQGLYEAKGLNNVPKVLVVCACRGNNVFTRTRQAIYEADAPQGDSKLRSDIMDIITCYSTITGFVSLRNKEQGTLFVQVLCEVLKKRSDLEICELFTIVNRSLMNPKEFKVYNPYKLAHPCEFSSRLLKKLYLKKKS